MPKPLDMRLAGEEGTGLPGRAGGPGHVLAEGGPGEGGVGAVLPLRTERRGVPLPLSASTTRSRPSAPPCLPAFPLDTFPSCCITVPPRSGPAPYALRSAPPQKKRNISRRRFNLITRPAVSSRWKIVKFEELEEFPIEEAPVREVPAPPPVWDVGVYPARRAAPQRHAPGRRGYFARRHAVCQPELFRSEIARPVTVYASTMRSLR